MPLSDAEKIAKTFIRFSVAFITGHTYTYPDTRVLLEGVHITMAMALG